MDKEELLKQYPFRIETHLHTTPASSCCNCSMERTLELYSKSGVNVICVTNHYNKDNPIFRDKTKDEAISAYMSDYEKMKELAKPYGIKVLLGCEIRFAENINDYLIYGVDRSVLEKSFDYLPKTLEDFRREVDLSDSLFIQAHPFRDNMVLKDSKLLDGMETMNMNIRHNGRIAAAARYAKENNISICVGGSDFHHDRQYYPAALVMLIKKIPEDSFELARLIKNGDYLFLLGGNHIIIP